MKKPVYKGFVLIPHRVVDSPAYQTLKPNAKVVLLAILRKHNGMNNGYIQASYAMLQNDCNISSDSTIATALSELKERQLIFTTRRGGLSNGSERVQACYALTWLPLGEHGCTTKLKDSGFRLWAFESYTPPPKRAPKKSPLQKSKSTAPKIEGQTPLSAPKIKETRLQLLESKYISTIPRGSEESLMMMQAAEKHAKAKQEKKLARDKVIKAAGAPADSEPDDDGVIREYDEHAQVMPNYEEQKTSAIY